MSKQQRIFIGIIVTIFIAGLNAYNTAQRNNSDYQTHPAAAIFGAVIISPLAGLVFYGLSGLFGKRKEKQINITSPENDAHSDGDDEKIYDQVAKELQEKNIVPGLWTKAYAEANGDEAKARAFYIKYRVGQIKTQTKTTRQHNGQAQQKPPILTKPPILK